MSLFGSMLAGGLVGGGNALQVIARDREQSEQRQKLEAMRAKADEERQTRLEEMRAANHQKLGEQQHGYRMEELEKREGFDTEQLKIQQGSIDARHKDDIRLREQDMGSRAADREADNKRADDARRQAWASLGVSKDRLELDKRIAEGKTGELSNIPQADKAALKYLQGENTTLSATLGRAMADPNYDPKSEGIRELRAQKEGIDRQTREIFERNGLMPKSPVSKESPVTDKASEWTGLGPGVQSAMIQRLEGLRGKPDFDKALTELQTRYGAPQDVLEKARKEPDKGIVRSGLESVEKWWKGDERGDTGLVNARDALNARRAAEVRAITPVHAMRMSREQAEEILQKYSTELPKAVRDVLTRKLDD